MELFRLNGRPTDKHYYLFNGDFVDRGSWSTEIALLLYAYKWLRPHGMFLNRGNHETDDMNKVYGFEGECKAKYNERLVFFLSPWASKLSGCRGLTISVVCLSSSPRVSRPCRLQR
jgi:serine/threonine-protein phosphatase 5